MLFGFFGDYFSELFFIRREVCVAFFGVINYCEVEAICDGECLFVNLRAADAQLDFPVIYASSKLGLADADLKKLKSKIDGSEAPDWLKVALLSNRLGRAL